MNDSSCVSASCARRYTSRERKEMVSTSCRQMTCGASASRAMQAAMPRLPARVDAMPRSEWPK
jgi:hypothetical protein